jgi:protein involved in polysaccharide export with SLBB domain
MMLHLLTQRQGALTCVLLFLGVALGSGQVERQGLVSTMSGTATTTNYSFARPNDMTIIVNVIGFVQRPGRYEIAKSIDLVNLLALAGGPSAEGTSSTIKVTRHSEVEGKLRVYDILIDLDNLAEIPPAQLALQPGDVIQVSRTGWATVRDVFSVVVSAAVITGAVAQVIYATKR